MINQKGMVTLIILLVFIGNTNAQVLDEEEELTLAFGDKDFISIATGRSQPIARAPAVASVITPDDIKLMGATDLDQILETVPGLHVSYAGGGLQPIYVIRGIHSEFNPQVLVLINGVPITNQYLGNRSQVWGGMPVNNITRIEIVRGPGSAVFGADAYAGIINIVTKTSLDLEGTEFGVRTGSFNTKDAWMLHSGNINNVEAAFSLELHNTNGYEKIIDSDAQTGFDALFGTTASLAPGSVNMERDNIDARLDLSHGDWKFRMGYQARRNGGTGTGGAQALDPVGDGDSDRINADISYHTSTLFDNWDVTTQLSYFDITAKTDLVLYPPGAATPLGAFPDGVIGNPYVYERHTRLGFSAFYTGLDHHQIRLGTGFNYGDMYKTKETKNFILLAGGLPVPLGSVVDVSDDPASVFIQPHDRENYYAFVQDEWSFMPDWDLTAGIRYDHYSDFGDTVNPRLALVWQTKYNMTSKLLYGRAFRAPSFAELYNINNPVAIGNINLDPETIDTIELAFNIQHTNEFQTGLNLFNYKMSDIIRFIPDDPLNPLSAITAQNTGDQTGRGFELEATWDAARDVTLTGNFAFQDSKDEDTDSDAANAPQRQLYVRADWEFRHDWTLNGQANWVADRKRAAGDVRPEIDDYTTVDMTLRHKPENSSWEFAFSGHNILDEDVREPSPAPGLIANDLPLAGSSYHLEVGYHL